jgi:hypothetical protein
MLYFLKVGEYKKAYFISRKYKKVAQDDKIFEALEATIDILNHRSDVAHKKFRSVIAVTRKDAGEDSQYLRLYSEYFVCLVEKGQHCDILRRRAHAVNASKQIKRWLPLPLDEV